MTCQHMNFEASCKVARLEDSGRFMLEVCVRCTECGTPFQFLGLPPGLNLEGATVSIDGLEANIATCPRGQRPNPMQGPMGYELRGLN